MGASPIHTSNPSDLCKGMAENRRHPQYTHPIHQICVKDIQGTLTRIKGQKKLNKPMPEQSLYQRESYACGKTHLRKCEGILCLVVRESKSNGRPSLSEGSRLIPTRTEEDPNTRHSIQRRNKTQAQLLTEPGLVGNPWLH